jgi:hypothetical protein
MHHLWSALNPYVASVSVPDYLVEGATVGEANPRSLFNLEVLLRLTLAGGTSCFGLACRKFTLYIALICHA